MTERPSTKKKGGAQLTIKMERFAVVAVETGNISEAYRQAYNAEKMAPESIHIAAYRLSQKPQVVQRIKEIQAQWAAERREDLIITEAKITHMLLEDRKLAYTVGQAGAAATATMGLAKLHGLVIDRSKNENTNKNVDEFTDADLDKIIAETKKRVEQGTAH